MSHNNKKNTGHNKSSEPSIGTGTLIANESGSEIALRLQKELDDEVQTHDTPGAETGISAVVKAYAIVYESPIYVSC